MDDHQFSYTTKQRKKTRRIGVPVLKPWCESLKWVELSASVQQT
jgi:hypothetical protein